MIVKIRGHILADYGSIPLVDKVFKVVSDKLFHLL